MTIPFWKMHGAGNDFILVDDRKLSFPGSDRTWMESVMNRRTGVGSDGMILIQPSDNSDFRMRFFNPDGREAEMCGNGARCVARLAHEIGVAAEHMVIDTVAGPVTAKAIEQDICLGMTEPFDWVVEDHIETDAGTVTYSFVNTGVPHVIVKVDDVSSVSLPEEGAAIRHHERFAPAGANANFVQVLDDQHLRIRTYERGVECETLACGTGMVAACLTLARLGHVKAPVTITCASDTDILVNFELTEDGANNVTMFGPAAYVFTGELDYSG